jgi:hypothetical protein
MVLLPDVQATRNFGRELQVRITERLGKGDVEGAWYDVMSMLYLSRKHYIHEAFIVTNLVGLAIENMGWQSAKLVLQHGNTTAEQLERIAKDLETLPRKLVLDVEFERHFPYFALQMIQRSDHEFFEEIGLGKRDQITNMETFFLWLFGGEGGNSRAIPRFITLLPFDRNIAGKRVTELLQTERRMSGDSSWNINSIVVKKHNENMDKMLTEKSQQLGGLGKLWRMPLMRARSQFLADYSVAHLLPAIQAANHALGYASTNHELFRIAVALERYKLAKGNYPESLDALVIAKYLEEVPLEPLTGRKTFVYKVNPDAETAVLLHSSQWDESGKDSRTKNLFIRL